MVIFKEIYEGKSCEEIEAECVGLAVNIIDLLKANKKVVAFAESCTGGLLAKKITDIPGASEVFNCSIVSYTNEIKNKILGVTKETLENFTAVSGECAEEMARGVRLLSEADYGVSVTGYAGNGAGEEVGIIYIGLSSEKGTSTYLLNTGIKGDSCRDKNRFVATFSALNALKKMIIDDLSITVRN